MDYSLQEVYVSHWYLFYFWQDALGLELIQLIDHSVVTVFKELESGLPVAVLDQSRNIFLKGTDRKHLDSFVGAVEQSSIWTQKQTFQVPQIR